MSEALPGGAPADSGERSGLSSGSGCVLLQPSNKRQAFPARKCRKMAGAESYGCRPVSAAVLRQYYITGSSICKYFFVEIRDILFRFLPDIMHFPCCGIGSSGRKPGGLPKTGIRCSSMFPLCAQNFVLKKRPAGRSVRFWRILTLFDRLRARHAPDHAGEQADRHGNAAAPASAKPPKRSQLRGLRFGRPNGTAGRPARPGSRTAPASRRGGREQASRQSGQGAGPSRAAPPAALLLVARHGRHPCRGVEGQRADFTFHRYAPFTVRRRSPADARTYYC